MLVAIRLIYLYRINQKIYSKIEIILYLNKINFNIESIVKLESGKLIQFNIYNLNYNDYKKIGYIKR